MYNTTIRRISERIERAEKAMDLALAKAFPEGSIVAFDIAHGQLNPSRGEVIGHSGGRYAYLRVRLDSKKQIVRDVRAADVRMLRRPPAPDRNESS